MASQRDLRCRRHRDTDEEDYCPAVGSEAEHSDEDDVRRPLAKRRKVATVTVVTGGTDSQQTRSDRGNPSPKEARGVSRRPKRRGKRSTSRPSSLWETTLERDAETDRDAAATFEEWPPLKRGPIARYSGRFAAYFYGIVHLGPVCNS
jgi:hypothetical protein